MPTRTAPRSWRKWAITLVILIAGAPICAAAVMVRTEWGRARMRDLAIDAIRQELGLTATLGEVEVSVLPLAISARDIALDDPVYGRFAEADGLRIRPSLMALLRGQVDLKRIELDRPAVNLVIREGEIRNLPRARGASGGGDLPFQTLIAEDARLTIDADPFGRAELRDVDLELEVPLGSVLDLRAECESGRIEHVRGTERVRKILIDALIDPDEGFDVRRVVVRTPHVRAEVRDAHIPLPFDDTWGGTVDVAVALGHIHRLPVAFELPEVHGILRVSGDVHGGGRGPSGRGIIRLTDARIEQFGLNDIELEVDVDPERVKIEHGTARILRDGGTVDIEATIGLGEGMPLEARLAIADLELQKLIEQLGVTPNAIVAWTIDGEIRIRGTLDPLDFGGSIVTRTRDFLVTRDAWHQRPERPVVAVPRARIAGRVAVSPEGLRFERLVADTQRSRLLGDVLLGFDDQLRVDVRTDRLDLADASPVVEFPIAGRGSATVRVAGTFGDPVVDGRLAIGDFHFNTFGLGDVASDFRLEKDGYAVRFPRVGAVKRESRYHIDDLVLDFSDDRLLVEGTMETEGFALADLYHVFHYEDDERFIDYQGVTRGRTHIRYTRGFPGDRANGTMVARMDLQIPEVTINGFAFHGGSFAGEWRWLDWPQGYRGGELDIDHFALRKGAGTVAVSGRMALGGALHMTVAADQIAVEDTEGLADRMPDLGGVYGISGDVRGTAEVPRANLDVALTGLHWGSSMLGDGRLYVRMTDKEDPWIREAASWDPNAPPVRATCGHARAGLAHGQWPADPPLRTVEGPQPALVRPMAFVVCGEGLGGRVRVDLAIGRTRVYPLRGVVELDALPLAPLLPRSATSEGVRGSITGRFAFTDGAMLDPDTLSGRILLSELSIGDETVQLRNRGAVDVRLARGGFRVARASFVGPSSELSISGEGSARRGLALQLDGEIDLGLLATLTPRIGAAQGQVNLQVHLNGPIADPSVFGEAVVRDAAFRFASFPEPIEDLRGRITFSARRVLLEDFRARFAGGNLRLRGSASIRDRALERYELELIANDVALTPEPTLELGLGADARLGWARGDRLPTLRGTVRLDRLVYTKPIQMALLSQLGSQRAEVEQYDPDEDYLALDLRIVDERPMRIANNLIDAEVAIEDSERPFRVVGTDQRFGVLGSLEVARGTVRFRNSDFQVRNGTIDFDDPYRVDPQFNIRATTEVRRSGDLAAQSWRITLHAHGNRDSFQLDTHSEPELSQEDLVLLLTIGMTRSEADQLQAGNLTSTAALEALSAVTGVDREVRRAVPVIDDFRLSSAYSVRTGRAEPQLSVGKRIADRVRVTASTGLAESRDFRTGVEWQLDDQTSVQAVYDNVNTTSTSSVGNVGVDLRWRLEFE